MKMFKRIKKFRGEAIFFLLTFCSFLSIFDWLRTGKPTQIIFVMVLWLVIGICYMLERMLNKKSAKPKPQFKTKKESDQFIGFRKIFSQQHAGGGNNE